MASARRGMEARTLPLECELRLDTAPDEHCTQAAHYTEYLVITHAHYYSNSEAPCANDEGRVLRCKRYNLGWLRLKSRTHIPSRYDSHTLAVRKGRRLHRIILIGIKHKKQ